VVSKRDSQEERNATDINRFANLLAAKRTLKHNGHFYDWQISRAQSFQSINNWQGMTIGGQRESIPISGDPFPASHWLWAASGDAFQPACLIT